jgi:DNA-binding FadR family transcriptional regulator
MRARHVLEPEIARIACININDQQLTMQEQDYQEMNKYLDFPEKYLECDKNFHSRLAVSTGNPVLVIMAWPLINLFQGFIPLFYERPGTPRKVVSAHDEILAAIRARNPEAATEAMRGHLTEVTLWFGNLIDARIINNE